MIILFSILKVQLGIDFLRRKNLPKISHYMPPYIRNNLNRKLGLKKADKVPKLSELPKSFFGCFEIYYFILFDSYLQRKKIFFSSSFVLIKLSIKTPQPFRQWVKNHDNFLAEVKQMTKSYYWIAKQEWSNSAWVFKKF